LWPSWFNIISVISWQWVLLVEEYLEEITDLPQVTDKLYHIMLYRAIILPWTGFKLTALVVIDTDCTGSCKSNYYTIMSMMATTWNYNYVYIKQNLMLNVTFNSISVISWELCFTLHWINGIIRNNKCIFTKLNAVFIFKAAAWTKKYCNG
jgi:hypothetical protein